MWKQLSEQLQAAATRAGQSLVHIGGPGIPGRTGVVWAEGLVLTLAREARDGESVPVVLANGDEVTASVRAWDPASGLALLSVPGVAKPAWKAADRPALGALVLTVAFPSPQGPEARLDVVRFSGGPSEWGRGVPLSGLLQTDSPPFPGFTSAVVVDADGALVGFVAENRAGNAGFVVPAADLFRLAEVLVASGSPRRPWLGVSTRPAGAQGLVLLGVDAQSPADQAGWKAGDLLLTLAGQPLRVPDDLVTVLATLTPGTSVPSRILRDGEVLERPVVPGGR